MTLSGCNAAASKELSCLAALCCAHPATSYEERGAVCQKQKSDLPDEILQKHASHSCQQFGILIQEGEGKAQGREGKALKETVKHPLIIMDSCLLGHAFGVFCGWSSWPFRLLLPLLCVEFLRITSKTRNLPQIHHLKG